MGETSEIKHGATIRGRSIHSDDLWVAMWSGEQWIATGRDWLLTVHIGVEAVVTYWLNQCPETEEIFTSWHTRVFPGRIKVEETARIAARELMP